MNELFRKFALKTSEFVGSPWTFSVSLTVIVLWIIVAGPLLGFSDTWQLVMATSTSVLAFLIVCVIQNTQNRNDKAVHLKLDELIRSIEGAYTGLVNLENLSDKELQQLGEEFVRLREQHSGTRRKGTETSNGI